MLPCDYTIIEGDSSLIVQYLRSGYSVLRWLINKKWLYTLYLKIISYYRYPITIDIPSKNRDQDFWSYSLKRSKNSSWPPGGLTPCSAVSTESSLEWPHPLSPLIMAERRTSVTEKTTFASRNLLNRKRDSDDGSEKVLPPVLKHHEYAELSGETVWIWYQMKDE